MLLRTDPHRYVQIHTDSVPIHVDYERSGYKANKLKICAIAQISPLVLISAPTISLEHRISPGQMLCFRSGRWGGKRMSFGVWWSNIVVCWAGKWCLWRQGVMWSWRNIWPTVYLQLLLHDSSIKQMVALKMNIFINSHLQDVCALVGATTSVLSTQP